MGAFDEDVIQTGLPADGVHETCAMGACRLRAARAAARARLSPARLRREIGRRVPLESSSYGR